MEMSETYGLEPLQVQLSQEAVHKCIETYPATYIIQTLLQLSSYLIKHIGSSILFGKPPIHDPFSPSLRTLYDRLHQGQLGPSRLPPTLLTDEHNKVLIHERTDEVVSQRPLEDFEDLYYAVLSSIKEIYQRLNDHIRSGFHRPVSPISPSGKTIGHLYQALSGYWNILNQPGCGKALDDAVRHARFEAIRAEMFRLVEINAMLPIDADEQMKMLVTLRDDKTLQGILFVSTWPPAMISVTLQQKYGAVMKLEKEECEKREAREKRQEKMMAMMKRKKKWSNNSNNNSSSSSSSNNNNYIINNNNRKQAPQKKKVAFSTQPDFPARSEQYGHGQHISSQLSGTQPPVESRDQNQASHQSPNKTPEGHNHTEAPLTLLPATRYQPGPPGPPGPPGLPRQPTLLQAHVQAQVQALEQERARQDEIREAIEWDMKKQRVSEYRNHLRARASPGARFWVQAAGQSLSAPMMMMMMMGIGEGENENENENRGGSHDALQVACLEEMSSWYGDL